MDQRYSMTQTLVVNGECDTPKLNQGNETKEKSQNARLP